MDFNPRTILPGDERETGTEAGTLALTQPPDVEDALPDLDAGNVIEEAEQLLRESAPHDFDVLVIGSGPGGQAAALRAAELGAHVGLVENRELGGTSLNRGCLPTKLLLESASLLCDLQRAAQLGLGPNSGIRADLSAIQARKRATIERLRQETDEALGAHNVEIVQGQARFVGKHTVEIACEAGNYRANAVHIVIATGSKPQSATIPGSDLDGVVTSAQMLELEKIPGSLITIGAGSIGLEMACLFNGLGAKSTLLTEEPILLPSEDEDIGAVATELLQRGGLQLETGAFVDHIEATPNGLLVHFSAGNSGETVDRVVTAELVLLAQERVPNTAELNLDKAGIAHIEGKILVDEVRQSTVAGVYAIGDCIRGSGSAALAAAEGVLVAEHLMRQPMTVEMEHVPVCHYTMPEIAAVGLTETQAHAGGLRVRSGQAFFKDNHRALGQGREEGWAKVVIDSDSRRLLGCQIIGHGATELINQAVMALKAGLTVDEFANCTYAHPTLGEVLSKAAGAARRSG